MDVKKLFFSWRFGLEAEQARDFDRRLAALTWIRQSDPATIKRIEWINTLPDDQRLAVAELYEQSFALRHRLNEEREKAIQLIAATNKLRLTKRHLEARIAEIADSSPLAASNQQAQSLTAELEQISLKLREAEAHVESEKSRLMKLEIEARKAAQVAEFPTQGLKS